MYTLLYSVPPTLQQAAADPCLHQRLLHTHGQVWVSLLWGHSSLLLGPGAHSILFVPFKSLFPQSCVSSDESVVGLISFKRANAIPRSSAPRAPTSVPGHRWPIPLQETLRHHSGSVFDTSLWVLVWTRFVWVLWTSLVGTGFDSKHDFAPQPSCWGFYFAPGHEVSFFDGIQHFPVDGCSAASCNFGVLAGDQLMSFYPAICSNVGRSANSRTQTGRTLHRKEGNLCRPVKPLCPTWPCSSCLWDSFQMLEISLFTSD